MRPQHSLDRLVKTAGKPWKEVTPHTVYVSSPNLKSEGKYEEKRTFCSLVSLKSCPDYPWCPCKREPVYACQRLACIVQIVVRYSPSSLRCTRINGSFTKTSKKIQFCSRYSQFCPSWKKLARHVTTSDGLWATFKSYEAWNMGWVVDCW